MKKSVDYGDARVAVLREVMSMRCFSQRIGLSTAKGYVALQRPKRAIELATQHIDLGTAPGNSSINQQNHRCCGRGVA